MFFERVIPTTFSKCCVEVNDLVLGIGTRQKIQVSKIASHFTSSLVFNRSQDYEKGPNAVNRPSTYKLPGSMKLFYRPAVKKIIASFFTIRLATSSTARVLLLVLLCGAGGKVWGQLTLGTSPYVQNFNSLGTSLPTGWSVYTGALTTSLGTTATPGTATQAWGNGVAGFVNFASTTSTVSNGGILLTSASSTTNQASSTNRALGIQQTAVFGDPGASVNLRIANTTGLSGFALSFSLQQGAATAGRTTGWRVDYGLGTAPASFVTATTSPAAISTAAGTFGSISVSVNFGTALDNYAGNVWIRIWAPSAATGSGARPATCVDDVSLSWIVIPSCTSQTITALATPLAKTYGDGTYSVATTATSGLTVAYASSNTGVATVNSSGTVTIVGAGTTTITASQAGNATYCAATNVTQTLTVNPIALTVSGITNANNKSYDGTTAATLSGNASPNGVLAGDVGNVSLSAPNATFNDANVSVNKPVTTAYTLTGSKAANYTVSQPAGLTADIAQLPITVQANSPVPKTFGTALTGGSSTAFSITSGTLVSGESINSVTLAYGSGAAACDPPGNTTNVVTPSAATGSGGFIAGNYFITYLRGDITVNKATPVISVTGATSYAYDGNPQGPNTNNAPAAGTCGTASTGTVTYTYSNNGGPAYGPSTTKPTAVGTYKVSATIAADANYNGATSADYAFTIIAGTITLSPATQTQGPFCNASGNQVILTYNTSGTVTAPFIQLSNASGSFASGTTNISPDYITAGSPNTIAATFALGLTAGNGYRARIISSDPTPVISLDNGSNITVTQATTPTVSITSNPAAVAGTTTICAGTNVTFTPAPANLSGATYTITWWKGGAGTGTNLGTNATYSSTSLSNSDVITCIMENIAGGCTTGPDPESNTITMQVTSPIAPGTISGAGTVCQGRNTVGYSVTNVGGQTYTWSYSGTGYSGTSTTNNISGNYSTSATSGTISVTSTLSGCTTAATTLPITVNPLPAQPAAFTTSSTTVTVGQTGVVYAVPAVSGATSYLWAYSGTGVTINGSTNSVTIDFSGTATSGTLSVKSTNACGNSLSARTLAVAVTPVNDLCANATTLVVGAAAVPGTTVGATVSAPFSGDVDVWYKFTPTCSGTATISTTTSGQDIDLYIYSTSCPATATNGIGTGGYTSSSLTTESATVNITAGTTYYIAVDYYAITAGSNAGAFNISVTPPPTAQPSTITGITAPCVGVSTTYSVTSVAGVTYTWSLPVGWTGSSTSNSINVVPSITAGTVSVTPDNGCTTGTARVSGTITPLSIPATPGAISGSASVCASTTPLNYSITAVAGAASYTWTVPSDWTVTSGAGTTAIVVGSGVASNNITVTATNTCGTSLPQTLAVTTTTIAAPVATAATPVSSTDFTANWNTVSGATAYNVDVYTISTGSNIATWTFPTLGTTVTPDAYSTNNASASLTTNTGNAITDAIGSTTKAPQTTGWNGGNGNKYWQILINASGFSNLILSSKQYSSASGPRDFKLQYSLNGSTYVDVSPVSTIANANWTASGIINNQALPNACDNQATVYLRWLMNSDTRADGSATVLSGGVSRIDDIIVIGSVRAYVSGYLNADAPTNTLEVTGLSASTAYNYVVRATNGLCISANSNIISVTTNPPCTPTATISSFKPATGPAKTLVTIIGTNFTGATAVKFGSTAALSFTIVNSTTIIAEVPVSAPTDVISVTVGGCDAISGSIFTFINQTGCGTGGTYASDLFISEVFDSDKGSVSYIEIFNGTNASINLASPQYTVRFITGTSTITDYALTGTVASGAVSVIRMGNPTVSGTTLCSVTTPQTFDAGSGFNGNDRVYLRKAGADIDYIPNPNYPGSTFTGFSQVRNSTTTGPTTTYNASQWTTYDVESCANLGVAPFTVTAPSVTISSHPADVDCNSVTFSVTASASPATVTSYLWKYNDPATMTGWSDASGLTNGTVTVASGTNTTAMTITGLTAQLRNYQFYCVVTKTSGTSCIQSSNAAQYSYSGLPVYRSKSTVVNGDWTTAANWEMATTTSGPWSAVCTYPIAANSSEAIIQTGSSIFLNNTLDIDKLTVDPTATLELRTSGNLTVYDSTATADLIVNGTLFDRASSSNGISYGPGATWILGAAGTIIKSNNSSTAGYRNNYYTGISNIPSTASWYYRLNGDGVPSNAAVDMFYPNLYFEYTGGALTSFSSATSAFTGGVGGFSTVKGNMYVGTTGSGSLQLYNSNINTQPMLLLGSLSIGAGSSLLNTSYDGGNNASHGFGTGIEIRGNITNAGTLGFTYSATNAGSGQLLLTGTTNQVVSGAGTFSLYDVTVNNGVGGSVTLNTDILVPHNLTFTNGVVTTTASPNGLLTLSSATNAVLGTPSSTAFVNGPMAKQTLTGSTEFMFPVGKTSYAAKYKPCFVLPVTASGATTYTAEFFPANPAAAYTDPFITTLLFIYKHYYWTVDRAGSGTARVALDYNPAVDPGGTATGDWTSAAPALASPAAIPPATNVAVVKDFRPAFNYWNFTKGPVNFNDQGPLYEARFYTSTGKIYTDVLTTFSPFTFGFDYNTILPVNLLSFTGQLVVADGKLNWKVADSKDLDGFELEYSRDGRRYEKLVAIKSNGGTDYGFLHVALPAGANYYRLLVKDKNGKTFYSQVVLLNVGKLHTYLVGLTPTIVSGELIPVIFSAKNQQVQEMITDVLGRRISNEKSILQAGSNQWRINTQSLAKGMYFITLSTEDGLKETKKFIKE